MLGKKKLGINMATITLERDGLQLVGTREEPFGEIYDMAIIFHGFTANRNTSLLKEITNSLRDENIASVRFDFNGHDIQMVSLKI